jgi:hypothetical protein
MFCDRPRLVSVCKHINHYNNHINPFSPAIVPVLSPCLSVSHTRSSSPPPPSPSTLPPQLGLMIAEGKWFIIIYWLIRYVICFLLTWALFDR